MFRDAVIVIDHGGIVFPRGRGPSDDKKPTDRKPVGFMIHDTSHRFDTVCMASAGGYSGLGADLLPSDEGFTTMVLG
jgi:hypothetical protein